MSDFQLGLLLLIAILSTVVAVACLPYYLQGRWDKKREAASPDAEWRESGLEAYRAKDFEMLRAIPGEAWTHASFSFQDEVRKEIGRFDGVSSQRGTLTIGQQKIEVRQPTKFREPIEIGDANQKVARIAHLRHFPKTWEIHCAGRTLTVKATSWLYAGFGEIHEGATLRGRFLRPRVFSQKILCAMNRELPADVKIIVLYTALLQ